LIRPTVRVERKKHGRGAAGIASLLPGPNKVAVGLPAGEADQDVINRAIWNEFGTRGGASGGGWGGPIPERPFMRNAMRSNRDSYKAAMKASAKTIVREIAAGKSAADAKTMALRKLGIKAQGDIQAEITSLSSPPNSPVTIALKGSSNPLIDSGELRAAITYKIKEGL
jgi:hypothetical protein